MRYLLLWLCIIIASFSYGQNCEFMLSIPENQKQVLVKVDNVLEIITDYNSTGLILKDPDRSVYVDIPFEYFQEQVCFVDYVPINKEVGHRYATHRNNIMEVGWSYDNNCTYIEVYEPNNERILVEGSLNDWITKLSSNNSDITWYSLPQVPSEFRDNKDNYIDADADPSNELQDLSLIGDSILIGLRGGVDISDYRQSLSIVGDSLLISGGGSVYLPSSLGGAVNFDSLFNLPIGFQDRIDNVNDGDTSSTNEIETWVTLQGIPEFIDIDYRDDFSGEWDSLKNVPDFIDSISWDNLPGVPLPFKDGVDNITDADSDPTNEIEFPLGGELGQVVKKTVNGLEWKDDIITGGTGTDGVVIDVYVSNDSLIIERSDSLSSLYADISGLLEDNQTITDLSIDTSVSDSIVLSISLEDGNTRSVVLPVSNITGDESIFDDWDKNVLDDIGLSDVQSEIADSLLNVRDSLDSVKDLIFLHISEDNDTSSTNELYDDTELRDSIDSHRVDITTLQNKADNVADADSVIGNEFQDLSSSVSGTDVTIEISDGTSTTISVADNDNDPNNELYDDSELRDSLSDHRNDIAELQSRTDDTGTDDQNLILTGDVLSIENGSGSVDLSTYSDGYEANTDNQTLSIVSRTIYISNGNNISLPSDNTGTDDQQLSIEYNSGHITGSLEGDSGGAFDLDISGLEGSDDQDIETLALNSSTKVLTITIEDGNTKTVDLSPLLQALVLNNNLLSLSQGGGSIDLSSYLDNTDAQTTSYSLTGDVLNWAITNGNNGTLDLGPIDNQGLSFDGTHLSIDNGNSVNISGLSDGTGTDNQQQSRSGNDLILERGGANISLDDLDEDLTIEKVGANMVKFSNSVVTGNDKVIIVEKGATTYGTSEGSVVGTDDQVISGSLQGDTLNIALEDGGDVTFILTGLSNEKYVCEAKTGVTTNSFVSPISLPASNEDFYIVMGSTKMEYAAVLTNYQQYNRSGNDITIYEEAEFSDNFHVCVEQ